MDRLLHLAAMAGDAPLYIVHLSSKEGLMEVMKARASHQKNFAVETCTQYLTLTDEMYEDPKEGLKAIMSPPLRKKEDQDALWQALKDGVIDVVATDHCPFHFGKEKQAGAQDFTACPNGAPGVEERMRILFSEGVMKGRITLPQMVHYLCTNPSRMYGLYPQKGTLLPGSDADLILYVVDASVPLDENDAKIMEILKGRKAIVLLNKSDLTAVIEKEEMEQKTGAPVISISAREETGMEELEEQMKKMFFQGEISFNDEVYITNARHKQALLEAKKSLELTAGSIEMGMPEDFFSIDLMNAYEELGSIIGEAVGEDLVNEIFSKFCTGK